MSRRQRRAKQSASKPQQSAVAVVVESAGRPKVSEQPQFNLSQSFKTVNVAEVYDADREFIESDQPKLAPFDFMADKQVGPNGEPVDWDIQATLYEVSADGKSYRLQRYDNKTVLQDRLREGQAQWAKLTESGNAPRLNATLLRESDRVRESAIDDAADRLLEGFDGGGFALAEYGDGGGSYQGTTMPPYGSGIDPNAEYIPMMCGPESKQLYQYDMLDMHRKAFQAYNHNPVAHQLCELQTSFVLGRGIDHTSTNEDVDEVWREFVDRTDFYSDLENIATDAWWAGEIMLEFTDDVPKLGKGYTDYRMIDPSTIWDIITDPEDIQQVFYMRQQYSTAYQMYTKGNIPSMRYVARDIPADKVLHFKLNVSKYEKRGRSDLFSVLGWLKRLQDLMNARVVKGQLEAAFVWDVSVNSGSEDISRVQMQLPDPYKPGSTFIHNKNIELKPTASDIKGNDSTADVSSLLNMIAVGFGVPKEFIGDTGKGGKSGSLTATEPGVKRFERRQRLIESFCHAVANRVINNAIKGGRLQVNQILPDARSVTKLGKTTNELPERGDLQDELQQQQDQANQAAQQQQAQQAKNAQEMHDTTMALSVQDQQHRHSMDKQSLSMQHKQAMTALNKPGVKPQVNLGLNGVGGGAAPMGAGGPPGAPGQPQQGQPGQQPQPGQQQPQNGQNPQQQKPQRESEGLREAALRSKGDSQNDDQQNSNSNDDDDQPLNAEQKKRIKLVKQSGNYSKEFLEFIFPSIAQEDRSAKLKDLALAEAMQWMPKSMTAKIAAKELNVTTYSFEDSWQTIVEESKLGMSIAHVYTQDNQHVPETSIAQDVQAEMAAKQPVAPQNQMVNVPTPPAVAGDKLMPEQPKGGAPGTGGQSNPSAAPGKQPNSGSTKTNKFSGQDPTHTDPTAPSHGYSAAANNPMANEGKANIMRGRQSIGRLMRQAILKEALTPAFVTMESLANRILSDSAEPDTKDE